MTVKHTSMIVGVLATLVAATSGATAKPDAVGPQVRSSAERIEMSAAAKQQIDNKSKFQLFAKGKNGFKQKFVREGGPIWLQSMAPTESTVAEAPRSNVMAAFEAFRVGVDA